MHTIMGTARLCEEPIIRKKEEKVFANFRIALSRRFARDGDPQSDFFSASCFGSTAEFAERYLHKGMKVEFRGELRTGNYEKNGVKITTTSIYIFDLEFAESKAANEKYLKPDEEVPIFEEAAEGFPGEGK
ncbi:MAG: single-stranded DNA-binding protein [Enterocloster asparagiformis]|nr:single-stranded DNA-binding protein [Enterocloster asparagiformis]